MPVNFYHRTTAKNAKAILRAGFKDGRGFYMTKSEHSGVWLSSFPLDANEGAGGDALLLVELDLIEQELAQFEWVEEGKGYREWLTKVQIVEEAD